MMSVGQPAPDFELNAYFPETGEVKKIKLSDYKGKWVVLCFYPADFTFICPTELRAMGKVYEQLKQMNTEVIAISTDTVYSHRAWFLTEKLIRGVKFPMASDPKGEVSRAYGVYDEQEGVAVRGRFIIDPDGIIRAFEVLYPNVGRNVKELIRQLQAFQYVREHPDEVCPAGWEPGKPTFKPGIDIAGEVYKVYKPPE